MSKLLLFLLSLLFISAHTRETQHLSFSIIQNDEIIGETKASKIIDGNQTIYSSSTISTTRVVIKITIKSQSEVQLENGFVRYAEANVTVRNRPYAHSYTQYCSGQCEIVKDGHNVIYIDEAISYASTMLLFEEPVGVKYSYSELDGSFHEIKKIGDHSYEKIDPKGKVNRYNYEGGILKNADIDAGLIAFSISRK